MNKAHDITITRCFGVFLSSFLSECSISENDAAKFLLNYLKGFILVLETITIG